MSVASIQIGAQAIKNIYEQALASNKVDFICLSTNYDQVLGDWFDTVYSVKLYDGKRQTREILPDTAENRDDAKSKPDSSQVKFTSRPVNQTDLIITPELAAFITYGEEPGVVMIEDKELVKTLKGMFESEWSMG